MQGDGVDPLPLAPKNLDNHFLFSLLRCTELLLLLLHSFNEREREREHVQRLQTVFPSYVLMLILRVAGQNTTQQESQTLEELRWWWCSLPSCLVLLFQAVACSELTKLWVAWSRVRATKALGYVITVRDYKLQSIEVREWSESETTSYEALGTWSESKTTSCKAWVRV